MKSNQKFKKKGMMLLSAVLAAFLLTMVASGYFMTLTGSFNAIKSGGEAIQAQRYAEIEANKLSLLAYNDLDSKVSQNVWKKSDADEGWEYKVNLGPEKVVDPSTNSKQRIATVSVRKEGDATDRFQMKVPLSVADSENGNGGLGKRSENLIWTRINRNLIRTTISKNGYLKVDVSLGSTRKSYHSGNQSSARYSGYDDTRSFYVNGILLATDGSTRQYRELIPVKKGDVIEMTNTARAYSQGWCTGRMHGWNMGPFYQQGCYNGHWTNQGPNPYGSSVLIY